MPGFTTHYLFGLNTYKHSDNKKFQKSILENHAAFSLGLQGPDVFFYFLPSYLVHHNNIGSIAHTESTATFLRHLIESRRLFPHRKERKIAEAYIAGFLGHYTLDTCCHPYIYWKTGFVKKSHSYYANHMSLEVDIDTELLQFYKHKLPSRFCQESTILLTRLQFQTICRILHYVYSKTYPWLHISYPAIYSAVRSIQLGTRFLRDPSGKKKSVCRKLEQLILGYPLLSSMIPSDSLTFHLDPLNILHRQWKNPWDKSLVSNDSFFDLLANAQREYSKTLDLLFQLYCCRPHSAGEEKEALKLLKRLGNKSYHSGLDASLLT